MFAAHANVRRFCFFRSSGSNRLALANQIQRGGHRRLEKRNGGANNAGVGIPGVVRHVTSYIQGQPYCITLFY